MKKMIFTAMLIAGGAQASFAQTEANTVKEKMADQYLGVQVNSLIRQVFNFNNTTTSSVVNPYLLNYSINSRKSGWGGRIGIGYNYNSSSSNDGITSTDTKLNDLSARIGVEKAFKLSGRWSAGAGLDFVYNTNDDHTVNNINSNFGGQNTDTKTTISSYGGGPMAWLRYNITDKIVVGTEASFYYTTGNQKQTISITDPNNGFPGGGGGFPQTSNTSNKVSLGVFNSPVVFFLSVKF